MSRGYVYVLSNESMPGVVKIGRTKRAVSSRANELYQTGVPTPFCVVGAVETPNCAELERMAHDSLQSYRVSSSREFFRIGADRAICMLKHLLTVQLSKFVAEFTDTHVLVEREYALCVWDVSEISGSLFCGGLDVSEANVAEAIRTITAEEVAAIMPRWEAQNAKRLKEISGAEVAE